MEINEKGVALSRAPDERSLKSKFVELKTITDERNRIHTKLLSLKEERRQTLRVAIDLARDLKKRMKPLSRTTPRIEF